MLVIQIVLALAIYDTLWMLFMKDEEDDDGTAA